MKSILLYLLILITLILYSCDDINTNKNSDPVPSYFHAKVDSLAIPDSVSVTDTLIAHLTGKLGPSGCYSFFGFEDSTMENKVTIKVIGKQVYVPCIQTPMGFFENYKLFDLKKGFLILEILNPDNLNIRDSILIY